MNIFRSVASLLGASAVLLTGCGGGASGGGGGGGSMDLTQVSNGFGQLLPHSVRKLDPVTSQPTQLVIPIRTDADLIDNVTLLNPVLPTPQFPPSAILPSGQPGNQFVYAEFSSPIDIASVLDASPGAQGNSGLLGSITLVALDPGTGQAVPVQSRVLVNGFPYAGGAGGSPPTVPLQHWVQLNAVTGFPEPLDTATPGNPPTLPGAGFPGCPGFEFSGSPNLISPKTIVFVADNDGDHRTRDTLPPH